jgi:hypothetical protein
VTGRSELWRTWLEAHLWIERPDGLGWWHISPRPDGVVGEWPLAAPVYLLTSYNPRGEELPLEENERRLGELETYLRTELVPAVRSVGASEDGSWMEPGFALLDSTEPQALAMARRFEQAAIYAWCAESLEVVGALDGGRASVGWAVTEEPEPPLP